MSGTRATLVQSEKKAQLRPTQKPGRLLNLRVAQDSAGGRVDYLANLAAALLEEARSLARDKDFTDETSRFRSFDNSAGFDFYDQVRKFETHLIKLALEKTGGNQARAARLLGLKATTLNSKIKLYQIEY